MTPARLFRIARQRLTAIVRPGAVARDIERELAWHLEELTHEKIAAGLDEADARREAEREFGAVARIAERSRDARGVTAVDGFVQDARYALRMLRRTPGFTAVAGLALAAGIGATAASAGVIAIVLARPLPFPDDDRLITIRAAAPQPGPFARALSKRQYQAWRMRSRTLAAIGAARGEPQVIAADGATPAIRVQIQAFTPSLFALLGVRPAAGRLFEDVIDPWDPRARIAVISDRLWQQHYRGAADIVGRRIRMDGAVREIVGVLPADFRFPGNNADVWIPLIFAHGPPGRAHDVPQFAVTARLRQGVTLAEAHAELEAIAGGLRAGSSFDLDVMPLRETLYGWTKPRLITIAAMATLLLLLACANVAALLVARGMLRRRELAMRAALGASRRRLVRQLLTESLVIGLTAALPGAILAALGQRAVLAALGPPPGLPRVTMASVDLWVLAATAALCVLSSLAFGALPSAAASRVDPARTLAPRERTPRSATGVSWRAALTAVQIALAQVLLITGALITISYVKLSGRELNFDPRGLISFTYSLRAADVIRPLPSAAGAPAFDVLPDAAAAFQALYERLNDLPGSGSVAGISIPPVNSLVLPAIAARPADAAGASAGVSLPATYFIVTPGAFTTLRMPILKGREFDARDNAGGTRTVVVNEAAANLFWPRQDPIGRHLQIAFGNDEPPREIIGIVANVPARFEQTDVPPAIYTSYLQQPRLYRATAVGMFASMRFFMRPAGDPGVVLDAARRAAAEIAPDRPLDEIGAIQSHTFALLWERRNYAVALDACALLACLLAIVGLYGMTMYAAVARGHEIAIRRALGADGRHIFTLVVLPWLAIIGVGLLAGAPSAWAAARLIAPQLWGVTPGSALTFGAMSAGLVGAAAIGMIPSIRRALAVDPAARLRAE